MHFEAPDYVVLIVADLERSVRFYTEVLGLPLQHRSGSFAQLDTGRTRLALYERQAMAATLGMAIGRRRGRRLPSAGGARRHPTYPSGRSAVGAANRLRARPRRAPDRAG
jgi:catechol 2,3-dioxygenase-like lactoylglutathione lyase family enzyme